VNAIWQLTSAAGNVLVIIIALIPIDDQATVFFMYTGMMIAVLLLFVSFIEWKYLTRLDIFGKRLCVCGSGRTR
jgi:drug/metabolite transporter superfamily protein YnfA